MQVLLEVEAPEPVVSFRKARSPAGVENVPYAVVYSKESADLERRAVEATREMLDSMNIVYRFSPSARVFAVNVTAAQLEKLVAQELIRSVVPNRKVKRIRISDGSLA